MDILETPYTNVSIQTFASEGDAALIDQRWEKEGPAFLKRLANAGLLSYERAKIWNKDSKLMRFIVFRYKNADAIKKCAPIWKEVEKKIFHNATVKITAYRGVTTEYWQAD